ncbi:uncharacterized protein [Argopecten irradians]|uniref:uncharacterized protein n=1 Tax=Argopecten irradians TaxID=31199 RepID=UPI00371AB400
MNTKLATGMLHTGIGATQVNSILTSLNIPAVSHAMLDRRQRETGSALEVLAKESAEEWREQEKRLTSEITGEDSIEVSVDAGWQKRGSGRSYDSLSGHCSMIGKYTGKITDYQIRSKTCRVCSNATSKNLSIPDHDYRQNWDGSAKAMEQDMIIEMVTNCHNKGFSTKSIIADDDSTTIVRLRRHVNVNIRKVSDKNHVKKNQQNPVQPAEEQQQSIYHYH